jgi:hypothetical protein
MQVIYLVGSSTVFLSINYGAGAHKNRVPAWDDMQGRKVSQMVELYVARLSDLRLQWFLLSSIAYTVSIIPIKFSICVQLLRITSNISRSCAFVLYSVMVLTAASMVARITAWTTRCKPFNATWDNHAGECRSPRTLLSVTYFFSAVCILSDWVCAILPIFLVWNVQLSLRTKFQVGVILSLGAL